MNEQARKYWNDYWGTKQEPAPKSVSAWQFGDDADYLAQLVIDGIKTATCSSYIFYEIENERLPAVDDYSIILNSSNEPVAMIRTIEVKIMPMNEVPEDFAISEGEGDRTYQYWKDTHTRFFTEELGKLGLEFSEDMMLVCERFELVDVKG